MGWGSQSAWETDKAIATGFGLPFGIAGRFGGNLSLVQRSNIIQCGRRRRTNRCRIIGADRVGMHPNICLREMLKLHCCAVHT